MNKAIDSQKVKVPTDRWGNALDKSAGNEVSESGHSTEKRATISPVEGDDEEKDLAGDRLPYQGPKS